MEKSYKLIMLNLIFIIYKNVLSFNLNKKKKKKKKKKKLY